MLNIFRHHHNIPGKRMKTITKINNGNEKDLNNPNDGKSPDLTVIIKEKQ
jgi:hypothetical protein